MDFRFGDGASQVDNLLLSQDSTYQAPAATSSKTARRNADKTASGFMNGGAADLTDMGFSQPHTHDGGGGGAPLSQF